MLAISFDIHTRVSPARGKQRKLAFLRARPAQSERRRCKASKSRRWRGSRSILGDREAALALLFRVFLHHSKLTVSGSSGRAGVHPLWKDGAAWLQAFTHRQCLLALFCQQSVCSPSRLPPILPPATAGGHPALTLCR